MPFELPALMSQNNTYLSTPTETNSEGESYLNTKSSILPKWPYNLMKGSKVGTLVLEGLESVR